jgi:tRNA(Arg) A34 adenosine deaminase TadA
MPASKLVSRVGVGLPEWAIAELPRLPAQVPSLEARVRLVVAWARRNFQEDTGGPFAAAVFEEYGGRLVSIGVNRVVPASCSAAHAEIMALSLAQQSLGTFDLGAAGLPAHQLVVNWRPCAMCFGALPWSGISSLAIAGSGPELEELTGFDEGPIHPNWSDELERRGIRVTDGVLREAAVETFKLFADSGRAVYNGRGVSGSVVRRH